MRLNNLWKSRLSTHRGAGFTPRRDGWLLMGVLLAAVTGCVSTSGASPAVPVEHRETPPAGLEVVQTVNIDNRHPAASATTIVEVPRHPAAGAAGPYRQPHLGQVTNPPPSVVQQAPNAVPPPRVREVSTASKKPVTQAPPQTQAGTTAATNAGPANESDGVASEEEAVATITETGQPEVAPIAGSNTGAQLPVAPDVASQPPATPALADGETEENIPAPEGEEFDDRDPSALQDFDPYLRDSGTWVEHPHYGTVWVPSRNVVGPKFVPYVTDGRWAMTDAGDWVWVSNHRFGWVVFHYGRWIWASDYGWVWIAGRTYSPAWVRFRTFGQPYIGWGPLPPTFIWRGGLAVSLGVVYPVPYVFCPYGYAFYPGVSSYIIWERYRVRELVRRSRPLPPRHHAGQPHRGRVASPPLRDIPPNARPAQRVKPSPYAMALSRRGSTEKARTRPFLTNRTATYARRNSAGATSPARFNRTQPSNVSRPGATWPRNESRTTLGGRRPPVTASPSQRAAAGSSPFNRAGTAAPRLDQRSGARNAPPVANSRVAPAPRPAAVRQAAESRRIDQARRAEPARRAAPPRREAAPSRRAAPPPRQAAPTRRAAPPPREAAPSRRDAPAPRRAAPPPRQAAPTRRAAPPPREAAPSRRAAPPPRQAAPPRRIEAPRRSAPSRSFSPRSGGAPSRSSGGGRRR